MCSKRQPTVALSSTEAKYIALTLAAKEATWLLQPGQQHALIKVSKNNTCVHAIHQDLDNERERGNKLARSYERAGSSEATPIVIPLKGDNQGLIAMAHNPVFHSKTKHTDIQHHYIRDEVGTKRIELSYIPTDEMIANGLTKALTNVKFYNFIEQMRMT